MNATIESIKKTTPAVETRQWTRDLIGVGEGSAQGDLNIIRLPDDFDFSGMTHVNGVNQLAPGDTQGSRHTFDPNEFDAYRPANFGQIERVTVNGNVCGRWVGYALKNKTQEGRIAHPEHAHHTLAGCNVQTYIQINSADWQRVRD